MFYGSIDFGVPTAGVQINILHHSIVPQLPFLVYHGYGDCDWGLVIIESGTKLSTDSDGRRLSLENQIHSDLQATCFVNGTLLLNATITTAGRELS